MQVIEAQCPLILEPHGHLHISHVREAPSSAPQPETPTGAGCTPYRQSDRYGWPHWVRANARESLRTADRIRQASARSTQRPGSTSSRPATITASTGSAD